MHKDLRNRSIGQMLDSIYHQYRRYFPQLFAISLFFELPQLILSTLIQTHTTKSLNWQLLSQGQVGMGHFLTQLQSYSTASGGLFIALLSLIVTLLNLNVFTPLLNGGYYYLANETLVKGSNNPPVKMSASLLIQKARKRWPAFVSTTWLLIGLSFTGMLLLGLVAVLLSLINGLALASVLLYLAALVAMLWIVTRLSFTFAVVVIEEKRNWNAIKRSWQLTTNRFWYLFTALAISQLILSFADMGFTSLISPFPGFWLQTFLGWIFTIIIQPLYALVLINLFWDFREYKDR